jgi:uncharacterized protein (DUF305 family)
MTHSSKGAARRRAALLAAILLPLAAPPVFAGPSEGYEAGQAPVTTTWFARRSAAAQAADRDYVSGMRPHHAGALSMSAEYLANPGRSSPLLGALSRAIVSNQRFEIGMLDEVGRNLDAAPLRLPFGVELQPVATEGLEGAQRFFKAPIPGPLTDAIGPVSETDVRFAKAMIAHHDGAVEMAREYLANPAARNGFLGWLNVRIVTDQLQEIALMRRVIAAFPGNPDLVEVPASMIHGMEGMRHGGGPGAHATPASASSTADPHAGHPQGDQARGGHAQEAPPRASGTAPRPTAPRRPAASHGHHH